VDALGNDSQDPIAAAKKKVPENMKMDVHPNHALTAHDIAIGLDVFHDVIQSQVC
jgi:hypothetical protein